MAAVLSTWEQAAQYDPTNPFQKTYVYYAGLPGGYSSYYYNQVPNQSTLLGAGLGDLSPSTWPSWMQAGAIGLVGLAAGYFGYKRFGADVKRRLGLSGARRRRR